MASGDVGWVVIVVHVVSGDGCWWVVMDVGGWW